MRLLWNLIGLFGLAVVIVIIVAIVQVGPAITNLTSFDSQALTTYGDIARTLVKTGNGAEATIWKVPVDDGLSPEDVEQTMKFVANEHNIKNVGELPLYKEVEAISGEPYRFIKIYMFCNAMTAARMIDYSDAFSAYLPCRVTLLEDTSGKLWLYTLNMDLMIHGGEELPPALKEEALQVKDIILDIMNRGAAGEF
ncbi:MAG: DUF302 domain-containing protein [Gammaproteobacteria bacterium]|nr:MAG: DUF302 domain-containing protein [Gammaproteobacteria bacterium]